MGACSPSMRKVSWSAACDEQLEHWFDELQHHLHPLHDHKTTVTEEELLAFWVRELMQPTTPPRFLCGVPGNRIPPPTRLCLAANLHRTFGVAETKDGLRRFKSQITRASFSTALHPNPRTKTPFPQSSSPNCHPQGKHYAATKPVNQQWIMKREVDIGEDGIAAVHKSVREQPANRLPLPFHLPAASW